LRGTESPHEFHIPPDFNIPQTSDVFCRSSDFSIQFVDLFSPEVNIHVLAWEGADREA